MSKIKKCKFFRDTRKQLQKINKVSKKKKVTKIF